MDLGTQRMAVCPPVSAGVQGPGHRATVALGSVGSPQSPEKPIQLDVWMLTTGRITDMVLCTLGCFLAFGVSLVRLSAVSSPVL